MKPTQRDKTECEYLYLGLFFLVWSSIWNKIGFKTLTFNRYIETKELLTLKKRTE